MWKRTKSNLPRIEKDSSYEHKIFPSRRKGTMSAEVHISSNACSDVQKGRSKWLPRKISRIALACVYLPPCMSHEDVMIF